MTEKSYSVTLTGPAKIDGKYELPGKTVTVSHTLALQLAGSGAIDPVAAQQLAAAISKGDAEITFGLEQSLAEMKKDVEARVRDEIGDELAALMADKAALTTLVHDLEDADARAKADISNLTASLTAEVNARTEAEKQLVVASTRIAELEETITSRAVAAEEAAEEATNTQKAGKKPAAAKD